MGLTGVRVIGVQLYVIVRNFLNWRLPCERDKLRGKKCYYPEYTEISPGFYLTIIVDILRVGL